MATTTHTPLPESLTPTPEAPRPRKTHRRFSAHHGALTWAAVLAAIAAAVALAVVTLTGGGDASRRAEPVGRTDSPAVIEGSDRHLYNLAEDIETRHDRVALDPRNAQ
jgi:anti-sigma-K factor RskA